MWLRISCDFHFEITVATPFILMLRPRSGAQQWIAREEYRLVPSVPVFEFTDYYGNLCQRLVAPPGSFEIHTAADVMTAPKIDRDPGAPFVEIQYLPDSVLIYLLPSRYCESELFWQMATEITAGRQLGYDQVAAIEEWLRMTIRYEPGSSDTPESAVGVNLRQSGVCRDLSHLGIALCRSLSIPARLVVGYLYGLKPMDMHAWFEAYIAGRWYTFDATQSSPQNGYVTIGYGRDAADVAVYNQFGPPIYPEIQRVQVLLLESEEN
ncbi:transglutaminase family protein [Thiomicrorhabdus sp.]|uniref:transglutaminase family protein n=1 Tax=Thiomicrorhabdus sp. TaxID=2039724 RepID=UPI0029C92535|nr:transglutaminase family protein [Thiomicrorhabdus sp.]